MSADEVDINAADQRAHVLRVVTTICRYAALTMFVAISALTYCCHSNEWTRRVEAKAVVDRAANEWKGVAIECRRWTE
jgi:hypothetical protein